MHVHSQLLKHLYFLEDQRGVLEYALEMLSFSFCLVVLICEEHVFVHLHIIDFQWLHCFRHQFVPQMIFLNSLFGYLSLLIIVKWCTGSQADLYHVMIYMFLSPTDDLGDNQLFFGQKFFQV